MNLLQELSEEKIKNLYEENGRSNISLVSLVNAKVVHGLHHEFLESPIAGESFLIPQSAEDWNATLDKIPELSDEDGGAVDVWTVGFPYADGLVLLAPDDFREFPTVQLFIKLGGLWGRLVLFGEQSREEFEVTQALVEFKLHCPPIPCSVRSYKGECQRMGCCKCKCVRKSREHGFQRTACWCPTHRKP